MIIEAKNYDIFENEEFRVMISGIIAGAPEDYLRIAREIDDGEADFNNIDGWYKILIQCKNSEKCYFWGDNQGSQYFFFDEDSKEISDSFLKLAGNREKKTPNYVAVAELIKDGRITREDTLVSEIKKTDYELYYTFDGKSINAQSKNLNSIFEPKKRELNDVVAPIVNTIRSQKRTIGAVCTGGTDSRTVLACLKHNGVAPKLVITGHKDNPDLAVSEMVAKTLGCPLTKIDPSTYEPDWLQKGFEFLDGMYDAVLSYRHYLKSQWNIENQIGFEFGGVGGEYYKNYFYRGTKRKSIEKYAADMSACNAVWCGKQVKEAGAAASEKRKKRLEKIDDSGSFLQKCNYMGTDLLNTGSGAITHGYSKISHKIDPLMDRKLIASVSVKKPSSLEMHTWQRKQIAKYCPALNSIPTDQGYTCSANPGAVFSELLQSRMKDVRRVSLRVLAKMHLAHRGETRQLWKNDYFQARQDLLWEKSVNTCKAMGIVAQEANSDSIPLDLTGRLILMGLIFAQ